MFACILFLSLFGFLFANTQMPKVFVDVESMKLIDPLRTGFQIILDEQFLHHYLNPTKLPTIFVSALALGQDVPSSRRMLYREDILDSAIQIEGLRERAWYYVCVEFENVVRRHARGNTSTSCQLARTLDEFGKRADGTIKDIQVSQIGSDSMEFQLAVDAEFPIQLLIFLESGSCPIQSYIVSNPKTLRVKFPSLAPGFNYGRLCVREQPLVQMYSMMGRDIHASKQLCHFEHLKTEPSLYSVNSDLESDMRNAKKRGADGLTSRREKNEHPMAANLKMSSTSSASGSRTRDPASPGVTTYHIVIISLIVCVVANILMPAIPLAYLITCSNSNNNNSNRNNNNNNAIKKNNINKNSNCSINNGNISCCSEDGGFLYQDELSLNGGEQCQSHENLELATAKMPILLNASLKRNRFSLKSKLNCSSFEAKDISVDCEKDALITPRLFNGKLRNKT